MVIIWENAKKLDSRTYICGYCGRSLASELGYVGFFRNNPGSTTLAHYYLYVCHHCNNPTYFAENGKQVPGCAPFEPVQHLPSKELEALYSEARDCFKLNAYTSVVMCCRKILMNVANQQGADEGLDFKAYVDYINSKHLVPANCKFMVAKIRDMGGEANHKIEAQSKDDATRALDFVQMLLKNTYEYVGRYKEQPEEAVEV
jgi:hypothetical protein